MASIAASIEENRIDLNPDQKAALVKIEEYASLGISVPITFRVFAETIIWRDLQAVRQENTLFTKAGVTVALAVTFTAALVEGVARAIFAVLLLPTLFLGEQFRNFYMRTTIGLALNVVTIPLSMITLVTNIFSKYLIPGTVKFILSNCVNPWLSEPVTDPLDDENLEKHVEENPFEGKLVLLTMRDLIRLDLESAIKNIDLITKVFGKDAK